MHPSMPNPPRKALRRLLPACVVAAAFAVWCAIALAAPTLTVELPDAELREVDVAALREPDIDTVYRVRTAKGDDFTQKPVIGYSLGMVFESINATDFEEIELGPAGEITLTADQLNDVPSPALFVEGDEVMFIRNSQGPKDVNAHHVVTVSGTTITQSSESSLRISASASRKAKAGETVRFQARHSGGGVAKKYDYEWDFDDGETKVGQDVKHAYDEAGTYDVTVTVTSKDSEDDVIEEAVKHVKVNIGEPDEVEEGRSGGGTNTADGAPASGTYGGDSGAGGSYGTTAPSTPYTPAPSTDGFDAITSDKDPFEEDGNTVEGALLANIDAPVNDSTASALRAARTGDPDFEVPESGGALPPAAWAGLGALFLMGAGAGLESGRRPRLRWPARLRPSALRR
jgi:hypothetical protein